MPAKTTYNTFKEFQGKKYTGVAVGRGHKWNYDKGVWKDNKVTPDKWNISYEVIKRRIGHAPEGSGAPVGTQYHWYILADQFVRKINANDYTTCLQGLKFKVAHKRADHEKWSISEAAQRKRIIQILEEVLADLKAAEKELVGPPNKNRISNIPVHEEPEIKSKPRNRLHTLKGKT